MTFDHYPTAIDLLLVQATGVATLPFRVLPMVGVRGTPSQILSLFTLPGLSSIYYNQRLEDLLDESVPLIGADRLWRELGYTGAGVTIAIIDSGIDATHPDLPFGDKVIQNVKVGPDLFGTGPIVLENFANTDTTSGHGTHVASTAAGTGAALFVLTALEAVTRGRRRLPQRLLAGADGAPALVVVVVEWRRAG